MALDFISSAIYPLGAGRRFTIVLTSIRGAGCCRCGNVMITTVGEDYGDRGPGQGPAQPAGHLYLRGPVMRWLPQLQGFGLAVGFVVSGAIVMGDRFSANPGIGLLLLKRGHLERLPADAGDLPGHHVRRAAGPTWSST